MADSAPPTTGVTTPPDDQPAICPWCGGVEPSAWSLLTNHWVKPEGEAGYDWCAEHGMCIAMNLSRNHVLHYASRRDREGLLRAIAHVEEVWPADRRDWIDEYRHLGVPPEHAALVESEQVDLFGEALA